MEVLYYVLSGVMGPEKNYLLNYRWDLVGVNLKE